MLSASRCPPVGCKQFVTSASSKLGHLQSIAQNPPSDCRALLNQNPPLISCLAETSMARPRTLPSGVVDVSAKREMKVGFRVRNGKYQWEDIQTTADYR